MDDKVFNIIEKMYSEMTIQLKEINNKLDKKADKSDIVRIENDFNPKVEALLDGYKQLSEGQGEMKNQLRDLNSKISNQEVEITVLRGSKQAAR